MKAFTSILIIFALVASTVALKNDICGLEHAKDGDNDVACRAYFVSWSYKADINECVQFVYGGCGGNENRFNLREECERMCKE